MSSVLTTKIESRIRGSRFGVLPVAVLSGSCEHGCSKQLPLTSEQPMDGLRDSKRSPGSMSVGQYPDRLPAQHDFHINGHGPTWLHTVRPTTKAETSVRLNGVS